MFRLCVGCRSRVYALLWCSRFPSLRSRVTETFRLLWCVMSWRSKARTIERSLLRPKRESTWKASMKGWDWNIQNIKKYFWHKKKFWHKENTLSTNMPVCFDCIVFLQVMLVDGFKGQKVQDVKKPIQKMMVDRVCLHFIFLTASHASEN